MTLDARDQSSADISHATVSGDLNCAGIQPLMSVTSTASFRLSDSVIDGGNNGIGIAPKSPSFQAVLTNTSIRNMKMGALGGGFGGVSAAFHMTGGELSNTASTMITIGPGVWTFTGVAFKQNRISPSICRMEASSCGVVQSLGTVSTSSSTPLQISALATVLATTYSEHRRFQLGK
jgi:hypothetical protein